jgi:DNA-binding transcriptional LysR family regulator
MKLAGIDANLLSALHALLQEANVTRAAKRLGIGQPAMSRSLARLRDHFGDPLLVPEGRRLVLSPVARTMAVAVERAASAVEDVFSLGTDGRRDERRAFVIACTDLFAHEVTPKVLGALRARFPNATLEVRPIPAPSSEQALEGADVALGAYEDVPPTVGQRYLFADPYVCAVREGHPVGAKLSLPAYLALEHLEVLPAPNTKPGLRIDRALGKRAGQRRVVARVPYFLAAAALLARSDLALTMTRSWARALGELTPIRVLPVPLKLPELRFSLLWHRRDDGDPAHEWLRDVVGAACASRLAPA